MDGRAWEVPTVLVVLAWLVAVWPVAAAEPSPPAPFGVVRVDQGTSVTVWERTTDVNELTYDVPILLGPGGTFQSLAFEEYTFTSNGVSFKIHCFRNTFGSGTTTGNNIGGARLNGVPGYSGGLWATTIVSYIVGYGGIESSRFAALGNDLTDWTYMGDQESELVLGFTIATNSAPMIASFAATPASEGEPVTFSAVGNDPDGDALTYDYDFDGDGTFDLLGGGASATHVFGDDLVTTARVRVTDGLLDATAPTRVVVTNVAPSIAFIAVPSGDEAESLVFETRVVDPGSDDLSIWWWGPCNGWPDVGVPYPNDPSVIPDPDPSPDVRPRNVTDAQTVVCGDDGMFDWNLWVEDDDGGVTTVSGVLSLANLAPSLTLPPPTFVTVDEGVAWTLTAEAEDAGSDDLSFTWMWEFGPTETRTYYNDGTGPDADVSPDGMFPFAASDSSTHTYGDDGTYAVTLIVEDDDGGLVQVTTTFSTRNAAPSITVSPPLSKSLGEGSSLTLGATASDAGSDDLTFTWTWELGPTETHTHYNDGVSTDPDPSPGSEFPFTAADSSTHTYSDDGAYHVSLRVEDDDGGSVEVVTTVSMVNVPPSLIVSPPSALTVDEGAQVTLDATAEDVGSDDLTFSWAWPYGSTEAHPHYNGGVGPDPLRSPDGQAPMRAGEASGQMYGDDCLCIIQLSVLDDEGAAARYSTTVRVANLPPRIENPSIPNGPFGTEDPIVVSASLFDPGSDDLLVTWSWGDGSQPATHAVYFSGGGPDPVVSPDLGPAQAEVTADHRFSKPGAYLVILEVRDDDGLGASREFSVTVLGPPAPNVPVATNLKPLVAAVFAAMLAAVGSWTARRTPWRGLPGPAAQLRSFAAVPMPFVLLEVMTGVASYLTGFLSIPPIVGLGLFVDVCILAGGLGVEVAWGWRTATPTSAATSNQPLPEADFGRESRHLR